MKNYIKYICLFLMVIGINGKVWGADETLTITGSLIGSGSGYSTSSGTQNTTASHSVSLAWTDALKGQSYLQLKASTGLLYSTSLPASSSNDKIKTITIATVSGNSIKLYGSTATDNTGWTEISYTVNNAANVYSCGYKTFKVESSGGYASTTSITVVYTESVPHTITFNAQGGTCATSTSGSVTSYVLPTASPSAACVEDGWGFYGWATSAVASETPTAPAIEGKAGDTYYPTSDITLHAVYAKGEYTKITSTDDLESGKKYIIAVESSGGDYYVVTDSYSYSSVGEIKCKQISETSSNKYSAAAINANWRYSIEGSGTYYIRDVVSSSSNNYIDFAYLDFYGSEEDDGDMYTFTFDGDGYCWIENDYAYAYFDETNYTFTRNAEDVSEFFLYKETSTPYYYSNPSCCDKLVDLSKGTQTNATISSFSATSVATCSSTAADRNVTITVAAATGYKFESTARLTFAKTSGTATATYVSGPTGTGPYTWVYRFAQNDNGAGTFSVTSATPKTYTVTLNGNEATSAGSPATVTATYNSSTLSSAITNPSRTGYTFAGWNTKADGTGLDIISTSGTLNASQSGYTDASSKWIQDGAVTLYAKWTINKYKVSVSSLSTVTIGASSPSIDAGSNSNVNYNTEVTLTYSSLVGGRQWCGWKVYKDGDPSTTVTVTDNKFNVPAYDVIVTAEVYGGFVFSCAELELDEPDNSATENVVSNVVYMTSTAGQKVRSLAHFHVHGDGLTPTQEVKFTAGSTALDALYTFKKADGTAVMTNASGEVDDDVYVYYQPTETSDGRDNVTSVKAYVERKGDGSGKPKAVINDERPINGRHLPEQFIIAAKVGDYWYALPADMLASSAHGGYSFTPNNASAPTQATVAPATAIYNLYGFASGAGVYDSSYVRFAGNLNNKTLWSNKSNASIGISNKAAIDGGSAKGEQYEWRLTNTGADTYNLWNHAANLTGRNLGIQTTDKKWNMYSNSAVQELRILPVVSISAYIELLGEDWEESAFTYTKVSGEIPSHDHIQVTYNGDTYTATESGTKVTITDEDFASDGGFGAALGTQLTLEWCDGSGNVVAQGSLLTPIFISSNTTNLDSYDADALVNTDVFVTNGAKLTVNKNITVHDVTVNSGSTLVVDKAGESEGSTLTLSRGKLTLRGGWTSISGTPKYDMPRVYINPLSILTKSNTTINLYMDIYRAEDGKHYYPFAVPFAVAVNDVKYVDPTLAAAAVYNKHYVIKRYNGANRAENGTGDGNWEVVPAGSILKPGEGYIITAVAVGGKAQLVVPMKNVTNSWLALGEQATVSDSTKNVIKVTAHTGTATAGGGANNRHKGWNMVGVPFMSCYTSGTDMYSGVGSADLMSGRMELSGDVSDPYAWETSDVVYVSVPTHDFSEYIQTDITTAQLVPGWSFFIQVGTTGNLTFLTTKQAESSSTPLYAPQRETSPIVKTGIVLTGGEKSDKTTLIISDRYSTEYEIGADLEKMFGNGYTLATYSITGGMQLAFNAMSTEDVKQVIPVGVRLPEDGEYTFSLNSQYADADIERLDLIDYETGEVTNLMMSDYRFTATRSQNNNRFALNVVPMAKVPTGVEDSDVRSQYSYPEGTIISDVRKIILDDKMFIIRDGLMYDATGKRVKEINK